MAKIAADTKFEDWTPPWTEGEIDEAKVAKLLFNALQSETTATETARVLKKENKELSEANEVFKAASDEAAKSHDDETKKAVAEAVAKVTKENEQLKADLAENARETDLLQVRVKFPKIDEEDIERLKGDDLNELLADAAKFAEKHGLIEDPNDPDDEDEVDRQEDESGLRRQPVRRRTPGDPNPNGDRDDDVDAYIAKRAESSALFR